MNKQMSSRFHRQLVQILLVDFGISAVVTPVPSNSSLYQDVVYWQTNGQSGCFNSWYEGEDITAELAAQSIAEYIQSQE